MSHMSAAEFASRWRVLRLKESHGSIRCDLGTKIRLAKNRSDRTAVFKFRYETYVNEMKRSQKFADHQQRVIEEPLDASGHILIAEKAGQTIGTARFNVGVDQYFGIYGRLYRLREFEPFYPARVSITTKLMVAREHRHGQLALRLALACYAEGLRLGTAFDFIDCNHHLVGFFRKLGYRQIFPDIVHPEYGPVVPMVLAMHDTNHLANVGSPFLEIARPTEDALDSVGFFHRKFLSHKKASEFGRLRIEGRYG